MNSNAYERRASEMSDYGFNEFGMPDYRTRECKSAKRDDCGYILPTDGHCECDCHGSNKYRGEL